MRFHSGRANRKIVREMRKKNADWLNDVTVNKGKEDSELQTQYGSAFWIYMFLVIEDLKKSYEIRSGEEIWDGYMSGWR